MWVTPWGPCEVIYCPLGSPLVLRSGYEWRGCPQAVSRESHRTRNKNKQTNLINFRLTDTYSVCWSGQRNLDNDYLETMNIDTLLVDQIRKLTTALDLENLIDESELTTNRADRNWQRKRHRPGLSEILSLPKDGKDLTKVSHVFKYLSGPGL